jgi:MATE family multidrug resistance protein
MSHSSSVPNLQLKVTNKQILTIALPIAAAILVPQLNFITNNIFLGHLGQTSLAAAGITGVYYLIFAVIGNGINNGLQSLISRRAGENRPDLIGKLFMQGIFLALGISLIAIAISYTLGPIVLKNTIHDPVIYNASVGFLKIRIWGLPFLYVYQACNSLLVGTNNSKFLIVGTAAETISNVGLDYLFIFGSLGFPALGFNGAAIASVSAEFTGMMVVTSLIRFKGIGRKFEFAKNRLPHLSTIKLILIRSSPLILQFAISIISWEFFYILIEHHGPRDLAVSNAMRNVLGLFGCASWAFASTSNTMVSNIIGQDMQSRVIPLVKKIAKLSISFALFFVLILNLFPQIFLSVYGQGDDFVAYATPVLRVISVALILMSFSTVCLNAITGTGNTKVNLTIEIVTICAYCLYVWTTMEKLNMPLIYGWMSEWLYWISMFSMSFFYLRSGKWKTRRISNIK